MGICVNRLEYDTVLRANQSTEVSEGHKGSVVRGTFMNLYGIRYNEWMISYLSESTGIWDWPARNQREETRICCWPESKTQNLSNCESKTGPGWWQHSKRMKIYSNAVFFFQPVGQIVFDLDTSWVPGSRGLCAMEWWKVLPSSSSSSPIHDCYPHKSFLKCKHDGTEQRLKTILLIPPFTMFTGVSQWIQASSVNSETI